MGDAILLTIILAGEVIILGVVIRHRKDIIEFVKEELELRRERRKAKKEGFK